VSEPPVSPPVPRASFFDRLLGGGLVRAGAITYGLNGATLLVNLATGILVARELGAAGRGELAAILALGQVVGWAFAMGGQQAAAYHLARHPRDGGRLIGSWLVVMVPAGAVGVVVGTLVLPTLFAAQTADAIALGQLYMLAVAAEVVFEFGVGVLLGDHDFTFVNLLRLAYPAGVAVVLVVLWQLGELSVASAVAAYGALLAVSTAVVLLRTVGRHGVRAPSVPLLRTTVWYGLRAHTTNFGQMMNARLDLLILPAFLVGSSVGLYSVATNVSLIVVHLAGALALIVLPAAARQGADGSRTVVASLHATLALGVVLALGLAGVATVALQSIYGPVFVAAAEPLRILLPGCVLFAAAGVLLSGLNAANRPFTAAVAQGVGLAVTVVGLLLFLRGGGITAAALVSTTSYTVVFAFALVLYKRAAGLPWRGFLPTAAELTFWRNARSADQPADVPA
jgi:O-antigen/teichoic acid export membrane protein